MSTPTDTIDRRSVLAGTAAGLGASLAGCVGGNIGGGDGEVSMKVGMMGPLSGPFASIGEAVERGTDFAASHINDNDSDVSVEVVKKDTELSPETGVQRARELVEQENVDVIYGMASTSVALGVIEYTAAQNVVTMTPAAASDRLTGEACNKLLFRCGSSIGIQQRGSAQLMVNEYIQPGDETLAVAQVNPDYNLGHTAWEAFEGELESMSTDYEVVSSQWPELGAGDYQNEIQAIIDAEPTLVQTTLWSGALTTFIQQARELGFFEQIPYFVYTGGAPLDISSVIGNSMPSMYSGSLYYFAHPDTEANNQFVEDWQSEYDSVPFTYGHEGYAGMVALEAAAKSAGSVETDAMVEQLEGLEWDTPSGTRRIRAGDHNVVPSQYSAGQYGSVDGLPFPGLTNITDVAGTEIAGQADSNCSF